MEAPTPRLSFLTPIIWDHPEWLTENRKKRNGERIKSLICTIAELYFSTGNQEAWVVDKKNDEYECTMSEDHSLKGHSKTITSLRVFTLLSVAIITTKLVSIASVKVGNSHIPRLFQALHLPDGLVFKMVEKVALIGIALTLVLTILKIILRCSHNYILKEKYEKFPTNISFEECS